MNRFATQVAHVTLLTLLALTAISGSARRSSAEPLRVAFVATDTDWTSAGVGGIGGGRRGGGAVTISLTGVNGSVKQAFLYWHGIDNFAPHTADVRPGAGSSARGRDALGGPKHDESCDGVYNVPTVFLNGSPVTGVPLGDSETNCWGEGSSRAFRADVTSVVAGNGLYTLDGMTADECDDVNGASLVVLFTDGNPANNRDLVFCEGNDSSLQFFFPGEIDGWHAILPGIPYTSGAAFIQLHVADGQDFVASGLDDSTLTISAGGPSVEIPDSFNRYDGDSTPDAGFSRSVAAGTPGSLWDIHTFDVSPVFTRAGTYTLTIDGQERFGGDCLGLVLAIVDLRASTAPLSIRAASWGNVKAMYR